jgi:septal ring factor EnvC (AmiA/AmiB activator)
MKGCAVRSTTTQCVERPPRAECNETATDLDVFSRMPWGWNGYCFTVSSVDCRNTGRRLRRALFTRAALVASILGLVGFSASGAGATGTSTPTTLPGPAPNQSRINAAKSQVSTIEATLSQEEQQSSALDDQYDTAISNLQNAQNALQTINASIVQTKAAVKVDRRRVTNDAVKAYIYGTPQSNYASLFSTSATLGDARTQYTQQIVGDLNQARNTLETSESHLDSQKTQEQNLATQAAAQAAQAKTLSVANQQEAAATTATLNQVQGELAAEVAQAAVEEAQQEAAAAARAATAAQAQREAAAAQAAAPTREPSVAPGRGQRNRWRWYRRRSPNWASPTSSVGRARHRASTAQGWCNGPGSRPASPSRERPKCSGPPSPMSPSTHSNPVTSSSITTWTRTTRSITW